MLHSNLNDAPKYIQVGSLPVNSFLRESCHYIVTEVMAGRHKHATVHPPGPQNPFLRMSYTSHPIHGSQQ